MNMCKKCNELDIFEKEIDLHKKISYTIDNQLEMMRLVEKTFQFLNKKFLEFGRYRPEELKYSRKNKSQKGSDKLLTNKK